MGVSELTVEWRESERFGMSTSYLHTLHFEWRRRPLAEIPAPASARRAKLRLDDLGLVARPCARSTWCGTSRT